MVSYRKNSIDVRPSKSNLFWFELYVNGMFWGQHRTEKASTDFGIYIIDDAINMLSKLDNTIVINTSWKYSIKSEELINLKILTAACMARCQREFNLKLKLKYYENR